MLKKISLFILVVLTSFTVVGQKKCKFDFEKEDKISGNKMQYLNYSSIMGGIKIQIGNNGPRSYFNFGYDMVGDRYEVIKKESDTLTIRLANKALIQLLAIENTKGITHIDAARRQVNTFYSPMYYMNEEQLKLLSESPILAFRFLVEGKEYTVELTDKKAEKIKEGLKYSYRNSSR